MTSLPFLPVAEPSLTELELRYVTEAVQSGWISSKGHFVDRFESAFAEYLGARYALTVSNGTAALHLALAAVDLQPGDEVIMPTLTFVATANVVRYLGATPVFCDVDPQTWCVRVSDIEAAITPRTKAIMPVHLYGHPVDMDALNEFAAKHNLLVVEDAAEALGALCRDRPVGTFGAVGTFSFYGNKIMTTGEGGMLVTDDADIYERARILRDHGMDPHRRYWHPWIGFNYRLTNMQAALGVAQLERIDELLARKITIARLYKEQLESISGLHPQVEQPWARSSWWMFSLTLDEEMGLSRDNLMAALKEQNIDSRPLFFPVHHFPPYAQERCFSIAERVSRTGLSLPSGVTLREEDIMRICTAVRHSVEAGQTEAAVLH